MTQDRQAAEHVKLDLPSTHTSAKYAPMACLPTNASWCTKSCTAGSAESQRGI